MPDGRYATTRNLVREPPAFLRTRPTHGADTLEGGLRTRGYYKQPDAARPLISVITPTLNSVSTVAKCIKSVVEQPYDHVEYIVIDGGSTDGTVAVLQAHDDRIDYWLSESDGGIYDAMNKGAALATGDWLYFLGADDVVVNVLHRVAARLKRRVIYYGDVYARETNTVYDGPFQLEKLLNKNICHQAIFYPRALFDKDSYDSTYGLFADYEFNLRCWAKRVPFRYMPLLISIYEDRGASYLGRDGFEEIQLRATHEHFPGVRRDAEPSLPARAFRRLLRAFRAG